MKIAPALAAALALSWAAIGCSPDRDEDDAAFAIPGIGGDNGDGQGDDTCDLPCLFGSVCIEGECVLPCDPTCDDGDTCVLGFCIEGEFEDGPDFDEPCAPACALDEVCFGGECEPAECDPGCAPNQICTRTGACQDRDACADDRECTDGACIGGSCVPAIDPATWEPIGPTSYVYYVELPPAVGPDACCFDINGDGEIDNAIATLSTVLAVVGITDIEGDWFGAIEDDKIGYAFAFDGLDGEVSDIDLGVIRVHNDRNRDDWPDQEWEERADGEGVFEIDRAGITRFGPETRFPRASVRFGELSAGVSEFVMAFPADALLATSREPVYYRIQDARIDGDLRIDGDEIWAGDFEDEAGVAIGGAISAEDWVDTLNLAALGCDCLGFGAGERLFSLERDEGDLIIFCDEDVDLDDCEQEENSCANLPLVCQALPTLSRFGPWDVDLDGDGLGDAASIGLRMWLAPAEIVE
ncbi:MAG: hypothetical protein ACJAYU_000028 [Bradymonadia bacterium]|jgi:hypothetical protein